MPTNSEENKEVINTEAPKAEDNSKQKTRQGSGYLKQLYATARTSADATHSHLRNLTTFLVNFVPVDKVDASELQVRVHFSQEEIDALAYSVKTHGVLQPILVVQDGDRYKVIAGERRLRAAKQAGLDRIPARVLSTDDKATHEIALRENLDRVDLHPLEEGEGYVSLLEAQSYTSHESIAKAFGKPKSRITECIGFTRLPLATKQDLLGRGVKNRALLRELLSMPEDQHARLIEEAAGREEILLDPSAIPTQDDEKTAKAPSAEKIVKAFSFKVDAKGIAVPSFKWKATDGAEKLQGYAEALKKLLEEVEEKLNKRSGPPFG
jgi:ParB family transcriptional regulator, chromosome partitioning protein